MTHTIEFKTAMDMAVWLVENPIMGLRVDLVIHLED